MLGFATLLYGAVFWGWILYVPRILHEPVIGAYSLQSYWHVSAMYGLPLAIAASATIVVVELFKTSEEKRVGK